MLSIIRTVDSRWGHVYIARTVHDAKQVRFKSAALRLIFDQSHVALLAVLLNASVYTFISWNIVDRGLLLTWFALLVLVTAVRGVLHLRWKRKLPKYTALEMDRKMRWLRIGIGVSTVLWGILGGFLLHPEKPIHLSITTFLLSGIAAGMVGAYAIQLRFMVLMVVLLCAPFSLRLWWEGMPMESIMSAGFMLFMTMVGRNVHRKTIRSIELGLENEDLVHRLNDASHEIRTPVSAIVGFAEVLRDHPASAPAVREYANIIYRNSQYLKKLVDNVLLLSRSNSNLIDDSLEETSLREQIQLAVDVVSKRIREKGLRLNIEIDPGLPDRIRIHTLTLQQILINLLCNSAKFTNLGEISIQVQVDGRMLVIHVRDTGIGVSPEVAELVFEPFWRENRAEAKGQEGSGLGLALSRSLATGLGGDLRLLESALGFGSTFELRLPVTQLCGVARA